jgi:[acyl-carrier-protein] S-malonyltransferase
MRALVINGDQLEDIEAVMEKVGRSLPEGDVAEIANVNRYLLKWLYSIKLFGLISLTASRSQVVISGTARGVEYACSIIQTKGLAGRSVGLPVSAPFHCSMMAPAADIMRAALEKVTFREPTIDAVSNVTGTPVRYLDEFLEL